MTIALGADGAGRPLLDAIADHWAGRGDITVTDLSRPGHYADISKVLAESVVNGEHDRGLYSSQTGGKRVVL
ncbi:hypothetical protein J8I29_27300 [Labrys sp. LIt4]|uniref:hypothetical protein n=1 Tax=Labrys sp. LIt4 TaxID=2821355 RepID=UPI001AE090FF|nr:hypothetical protein [Labrys sp. LIt4]MBP0583063.1 hypothetical protein [Labrys sp. LIt4]